MARSVRKHVASTTESEVVRQASRGLVQRQRVLQINRNYQPVTTITLRKAINKILCENAVIVLPPGDDTPVWQELTWDDWAEMQPRDGETVLQAAKRVFKIPEIIKCTDYGDVPFRKVKLSRRAIFQRDNYTCQYCGKSLSPEDGTIDHVVPRCQGGKTEWLNVLLACSKCNRKKDDKSPEEANMKMLKKPHFPEYDILQGRKIRVDSWSHFLGDSYWLCPLKEE